MSEISKKELASALKWTWIIIVGAVVYNSIAPSYYFMRQKGEVVRGHRVTGTLEYLDRGVDELEWVDITKLQMRKNFRDEIKKIELAHNKANKIDSSEFVDVEEETPDFFAEIEMEGGKRGR